MQRIGWAPALLSFAAALAYTVFVALHTYEVDLGVYLRLGGGLVFTPHLYSFGLRNTGLLFTYPPFAALLFAPAHHFVGSVHAVQAVWTMGNLAALLGLIVVSLRAVRPDFDRGTVTRLALTLSMPALLLNPVLVTVGFGQVNLVVALLIMWDLLTERRVGRWQVPQGIAIGLAAAIKLTPLLFVPYLLLTRRRRGAVQSMVTFVVCEFVTFLASPTSSSYYWTRAVFRPGRAGKISIVRNQDLWAVVDRVSHGLRSDAVVLPLVVALAAAGLWVAAEAHRRSSPMLGVLVCAGTGLLVSPVSWVHHMVWVVPAIVWLALADDRPRHGLAMAAGAAILFWSAPIWWVPFRSTSDLHLTLLQLVAANSFFLATVLFLGVATVLVTRRRRSLTT